MFVSRARPAATCEEPHNGSVATANVALVARLDDVEVYACVDTNCKDSVTVPVTS